MKKIANFTCGLLLLIIAVSCTDLSSINQDLEDLKSRVSNLENLMKNANSRIETLQVLIDAEAGKKSIEKWTETSYGYELIMSDGSKLSLMNGRNGKTPDISVKELNGTLYWTINGELMRDSGGEPIKAKAEDGKMPKVQITADGFWQISTDDGATWKVLRDENGERVRAKGLDATDTFSITETDAAIVINFDGKTFTISKNAGGSDNPGVYDPDKLALEYVSEFGVATEGKSFATSNGIDQLGMFSFDEAKSLFAERFLAGIYHFPSASEWLGVFPSSGIISFTESKVKESVKETIKVGKGQEEKEYTAEYNSVSGGVVYGIKFIGDDNRMRTAYRYRLVNFGEDNNMSALEVTARLIGSDAKMTLDAISKEDFWSDSSAKYVKRLFPTAGYISGNSHVYLGTKGFYPASDDYQNSGFNKYKLHGVEFDKSKVRIHRSILTGNTDKYKFSVRPFSDY